MRTGIGAGLALVALLAAGCSTLLAVKDQQRRADELAVVAGTVAAEGEARGPLVVALFTRAGEEFRLVDYFVAAKPGPWLFAVEAGTYSVAAFEDVNGDGAYQDEPFHRPDPAHALVLAPGQRVTDRAIVVPRAGRALQRDRFTLATMMARSAEEQHRLSIFAVSAAGTVTTLDDPRFSPASGAEGMWRFYDRTRFQPWVLSYPSGGRLDVLVAWVDELFTRLELALGVTRAAVVAHSMGGLVARGFVLRHHETSRQDPIRTFVTISSPLGGMASAGDGVERSPVVIRSWYGLAPGSAYLDGLFYADPARRTERRRLPDRVAYHLLFGFKGGGRDGASDGTVLVASQLRPEAQAEARSLRGYDETHVGILASPAAVARVHEILAELR